jgi:hypothetical protein
MYESIALRLAPLLQMCDHLRSGRPGHTRAMGTHQVDRQRFWHLRPVLDIDCRRALAICIVFPLVFNIWLILGYRALGVFLNRNCNSRGLNIGNSHSEKSPALTAANIPHDETLSVQLIGGSCGPVHGMLALPLRLDFFERSPPASVIGQTATIHFSLT